MLLEGFWVSPKYIGKGMGRKLFEHMKRSAAALGAQSVEWDSDPNATPFYLHMGAKRVGETSYVLFGEKRVLQLRVQR